MNHDITHCNQDKCPKKDTCYRYQAWMDIKNNKMDGLYSMLKPAKIPCELYMTND